MAWKKSNALPWAVFLLVCAAAAAFGLISAGKPATPKEILPAGRAGSFLLVRVPEITAQYESGIETMKQRMDEWLAALSSTGFHPMLLSEALRRMERNEGLPEQTVVFFFSPGYRKTFEIAGPIFAQNHCPAVWITDVKAMKRADRRYLTFHATRKMKASDAWDIGFMAAGQQGPFRLNGSRTLRWSPAAGAFALNRRNDLGRLNCLNLNADWTAEELVSRLRAEVLAMNGVNLAKAVIHAREWGVALRRQEGAPARFDLQAPAHLRRTRLFWLSTLGRGEFHIDMSVGSLTGDLCLHLRYDEASGDDTRIILSNNSIFAEQQRGNMVYRLGAVPLPAPVNGAIFSGGITVSGNSLAIETGGQRRQFFCPGEPMPAGRGIVQLSVADRFRGTARASGVRLTFTPRGKSST